MVCTTHIHGSNGIEMSIFGRHFLNILPDIRHDIFRHLGGGQDSDFAFSIINK